MKNLISKIAGLLVLSTVLVTGAFGNAVSFDTTFNGTGYRLQTVGTENAFGYSLAIQGDGKLVVGGRTTTASENNQLALIRLNSDGTLDTSFGSGGSAFSPAGVRAGSWDPKVLIQPDGKILLAATAVMPQQQAYSCIVLRYTTGGVLDTTFNNTGYATANIPTSSWDICHSMGLAADGKIVLVGQTLTTRGSPTDWDISAVRFNANGSLDTTFDGDGLLEVARPTAGEAAYSVLVLAGGKILVGARESTSDSKYLVMRLNADGSTDTTFGTAGYTTYQLDFTNNWVTSMALQSDGKVLVAGGGKVTRLTADGIRDMSFGSNGTQRVSEFAIDNTEIRVIGGDKFLVGFGSGVKRFMRNGGLDTNYNGSFSLTGNGCGMHSLVVQSDGKALLAGTCRANSDNIYRFVVARFQENRTKRFLDFNGDELTDISIFRPSNGQWRYLHNFGSTQQIVLGPFGAANDRPVPAEFTGDGKTDVAVFRPSTGEWFVLRSEENTFYSFPFGTSGDVPVVGNFDDDQLADAGVFRPATGHWYIQKSTGGISITHFGTSGDKPVSSDYDGDFKTDMAIYRPSVGQWWIQRSSDGGVYAFQFGNSNDSPVVGDYTGDNKTDAAFYRPSTGEWFVLRSEDLSYFSLPFGLSDDLPAPGNFLGDARFDFVVFRPSTNRWYLLQSGGGYSYLDFGEAGDVPLSTMVMP